MFRSKQQQGCFVEFVNHYFFVIIICYFDVAFSTIYDSFQSISHHSCIKATDLPKTEIY